jgi:hypothetical protein
LNVWKGFASKAEPNSMQSKGSFGKRNRVQPSPGARETGPTPPTSGDGTKLTAGFIATAVALFVAVGSGTFVFLNGGVAMPSFDLGVAKNEPAYVSSVDKTCGKGWEKDLPNVDQMHCYLTSSKRRLCDPKERAHLVATIGRLKTITACGHAGTLPPPWARSPWLTKNPFRSAWKQPS